MFLIYHFLLQVLNLQPLCLPGNVIQYPQNEFLFALSQVNQGELMAEGKVLMHLTENVYSPLSCCLSVFIYLKLPLEHQTLQVSFFDSLFQYLSARECRTKGLDSRLSKPSETHDQVQALCLWIS